MHEPQIDPFEIRPFQGYLDTTTGRPEMYLSLSHLLISERFVGVDEQYRKYLLSMDDPDLMRLEFGEVGLTAPHNSFWHDNRVGIMQAGIYMQAVAHKERYQQILYMVDRLEVPPCAFTAEMAEAMGRFIGDINTPGAQLKVCFLGTPSSPEFAISCFDKLFAKRKAQCLMAIEDDGCSITVSELARNSAVAFSCIDSSQSDLSIAESIKLRCSHVFHFCSEDDSELISQVIALLKDSGVSVTELKSG